MKRSPCDPSSPWSGNLVHSRTAYDILGTIIILYNWFSKNNFNYVKWYFKNIITVYHAWFRDHSLLIEECLI